MDHYSGNEHVCSTLSFRSTVCRCLWQSGLSVRHPLLRLPLKMQQRERRWCAKRQSWIQEWQYDVFPDESHSACSILMALYISRGSREIARRLLAIDIGIVAFTRCDGFSSHWIHDTYISTSGRRYISDVLNAEVAPYLRGLPNAIFQMQDKMLRVVFWPSAIHRVFDCCLGLHCLQICHPLKTSVMGCSGAGPPPFSS